MGLQHEAYLWEAVTTQPDNIILQEQGGWPQLQPYKHSCIALRFKPQRKGFVPVVFDFRPEDGFCLECVGWENQVQFGAGNLTHRAANFVHVRQYFEVPQIVAGVQNKKLTWFDFYYTIMPNGIVIASTKGFDAMHSKVAGLLHG